MPVLLVQGGIHAGEIDGKDAGFLALRQVLDGEAAPGALDDRSCCSCRCSTSTATSASAPGTGPTSAARSEMGWRTTAQNYNLNRDYVKADAPEMQAMLALVNAWDPLAYVDLHVTDGAKFEHDVSIQVEPVHAGDAALREAGRALRDGVVADLARAGFAAAGVLPLVRRGRQSAVRLRRQRAAAAFLAWLLAAAQPHRHAGRDAFVEGLPDPRAHHPQHDRVAARACRRATAAQWLQDRRTPPMRARPSWPASRCRSTTSPPTRCARSISAATSTRARHRTSPAR